VNFPLQLLDIMQSARSTCTEHPNILSTYSFCHIVIFKMHMCIALCFTKQKYCNNGYKLPVIYVVTKSVDSSLLGSWIWASKQTSLSLLCVEGVSCETC
jgi:hypothetical protein